MTLTRAALMLATLVATGTCWAGGKEQTGAAAQPHSSNNATPQVSKSERSSAPAAAPTAAPAAAPEGKPIDPPQGQLVPRVPQRKLPIQKPAGDSQLLVKFTDAAQVRIAPDKTLMSRSSANAAINEISAVANQFNLTFVPAINKDEQYLHALEARAAAHSGKAQPDLAGMMYVVGPNNATPSVGAAQALSNLGSVEFAYFQATWKPYDIDNPKSDGGIAGGVGACCIAVDGAQNCVDGVTENDCTTQGGLYEGDGTTCATLPGGCPTLGACCLVDQTCVPLSEVQCTGVGGTYHGDGSNCILDGIDCNNTGCGDPQFGTCFLPHDGLPGDPPPSPFCDNADCCDLVGGIRPFCIDEQAGNWDVICVAIANLFCQAPPADRCLSLINGSCFEPHSTQGCIDSVCCYTVCGIDTFCCEIEWDVTCVQLAIDNCNPFPPGGPTPDFTPLQGYLRRPSYNDQPGGAPLGLALPAPNFPGYGGEGWYLFDDSLIIDDPTITPTSVRFAGLYGLGRQLQEVYHVGDQSQARGLGVKIAVIEWAFYKNHEDLDVIPEPGQTMIMIPEITEPSHATACLGILNAQYNGIGIVGVAPDAQAYFFPLTSIEEGPRFLTAFISCYNTLGPGDVVSCSFGPGGSNLNNDQGDWVLMRMGSDLGITTCVAAGNDCKKLDDLPADLGDSGAIVVGACTPGRNFCRLTFSNHYEDLPAGDSRRVDVAAWGDAVTSCATAVPNLFFPSENWNRSYGNAFNGTSAATPQIAGLAACLQGLAKQFYGIPLSPGQIKSALTFDGFPQCGFPNPEDLPGFDESMPCGPDTDPEQAPNKIGPYPRPDRSGAFILSQSGGGFDGSPLIDDFTVIRGVLNFGNIFSLKTSDNSYLIVSTLWTEQNFQPDIPGPASQVTYMATAQTADLMVTAHSDKKTATAMLVNTEMAPTSQPGLMMVEMYDWVATQWAFVDFAMSDTGPICTDGGDLCNQFVTDQQASRFINPNNNNVLIRFYVIGMGGPDPNAGNNNDPNVMSFPVRWDQVNLAIANGFGQGGAGTP